MKNQNRITPATQPKKTSYVLGFMFNSDKSLVVLINKIHPSWQAGKLNGLGGKMNFGESPVDAMVREFREEAAMITEPKDWQIFARMFSDAKGAEWEVFCFVSVCSGGLDVWASSEESLEIVSPKLLSFHNGLAALDWLIPMAISITPENKTYANVRYLETPVKA